MILLQSLQNKSNEECLNYVHMSLLLLDLRGIKHQGLFSLWNPVFLLQPLFVLSNVFAWVNDLLVNRVQVALRNFGLAQNCLLLGLQKRLDFCKAVHAHEVRSLDVTTCGTSAQVFQGLYLLVSWRVQLFSRSAMRWSLFGHSL